MKIEKKVWPVYFQKIHDGIKKYEIRLADFDCKEGDELVLKEWDPLSKQYTGRELTRKVTYTLKTKEINFWTKKEIDKFGFQIISFE